MEWYGVIKKIISLEFPNEKEVIMFQCDWYDVPAAAKNKGRGYNKDQYGIIDIDTTRFRYVDDPYILGTQSEQVFYVQAKKNKPEWSTVVRMIPRNLFAMPEEEKEGEKDVNSLVVGVEDMNVSRTNEELTNWRRSDMEGISGDASIIQQAIAGCAPEPTDADLDFLADEEHDDDDTYIDDGLVAPVNSLGQGHDDEFFV
jgi:hypothetical protein